MVYRVFLLIYWLANDIDPALAWLTVDVQVLQKPFLNFLLYFNCIFSVNVKNQIKKLWSAHYDIYLCIFLLPQILSSKAKTIDFPSVLYFFLNPWIYVQKYGQGLQHK